MLLMSDTNQIIGLMKEFAKDLPVDCALSAFSPRRGASLIQESIAVGLCKIVYGEDREEALGFVLGVVSPNIWSEHFQEIQLLALYIKPEYRKGTAGGRLFKSYLKSSEELINKNNNIGASIVYEQPTGTNINYKKIGYKPIQIQYIREV